MKNLWKNDEVQFARLIAEIEAAGGFTAKLIADLSDSMDLDATGICEIIDRAQESFAATNAKIK